MRDAQYAVRGELVLRSLDHARARRGTGELLLTKSSRATLAAGGWADANLLSPGSRADVVPELLSEPAVVAAMPQDVVERAQKYLSEIPAGTGAYSPPRVSRLLMSVILCWRGGREANPEHIFLTDGASPAVQMGLKALIAHERVGIMIPIPQYPLYSAAIAQRRSRRWLLLGRAR